MVIELAVVIIAALFASRNFINSDPNRLLNGRESEWLTNSAYITADNLRDKGALTFWQPYLAHGEPAIDNPFSFVLNPLSLWPSLIAGPQNGIKYSIVIYTIFAGLGGWLLARMLGLGSLARVLLGLIMIGRGNMHAEIMDGYFQLGVTMAYYPWVVAAMLALVRFRRRIWPVILLALMMTWLFWAGNVYHFLPAGMIIGVLTLVFAVKKRGLDGRLIGRVIFALALTFGLMAITALPILAHQNYIEGHPDEALNTVYAAPMDALGQFFTSVRNYPPDTWNANYYSFVLPLWFVVLILVVFPPIPRVLARSREAALHWRVIGVAVVLFVFFLLWGTGTNPIMRWAITHLPLIGQWRTLSRLLTVAAFWLAVLAAIRVDSLWRALVIGKSLNTERWRRLKPLMARLHLFFGAILIIACALAAKELIDTWFYFSATMPEDQLNVTCLNWLRAQHPNDQLSVFKTDYTTVAVFLRDHIRLAHITADFHPRGMTPTIYPYDLRSAPPEYVMPYSANERNYWANLGYSFIVDSPRMDDGSPCLMQNPNTLSYGFSVPLNVLNAASDPLPPALTEPLTAFRREDDHIAALVTGRPDQALVVVFQEIAWPGWNVTVDGKPATLESVGQMIGVVLPPGQTQHAILFYYDPPLLKIGALISLATALLSIGLLFRQARQPDVSASEPELVEALPEGDVYGRIAARIGRGGERVHAFMSLLWGSKRIRLAAELALIVLAALYASQYYLNNDPNKVLIGNEAQWLTSSAYITADTFQREGRLSLWEPWIAHGEPALENPFSFVLNPISTFPVLVAGAENGIKYSIVLYTILAGLGGWLLGKVLHLSWIGRLFLAAVCIGRGNVPAELGEGYYQLGVTQFYFPWVAAATLAIIRYRERRWPVVLLTITITLLFWAGNIYYTLPALIIVITLALCFAIKIEARRPRLDWAVARRVALALALSVGLAAATLLPIYAHQQYIGSHPNEDPNAIYENPLISAIQFFITNRLYTKATWSQNYFSFVLPFWFVMLIFFVFPISAPRLHRSADSGQHGRVYVAGLFLIVLFFTWATKTNPIITWAYANLPLIGQWRVLSRMLTVSAFWIGVLAALRLDGLWRGLVIERRFNAWIAPALKRAAGHAHQVIAAILIVAAAGAAFQLISTWLGMNSIDTKSSTVTNCVGWLHDSYPTANMSVYGDDYYYVGTYIEDHIRFPHINAEFSELGMTPTIYNYDLTTAPSDYLIALSQANRDYWRVHDYQFVVDGPQTEDFYPCLMTNTDTLPYAFSAPIDSLSVAPNPLPTSLITPIWAMNRRSDAIALVVDGDPIESKVVVVQELAWPGWNVTIDGAPATLESVGQMIGVVLPQDQAAHQILFYYDPPLLKIGGLITLATALICAIYLMGGNQRIFRRRHHGSA
ncbi:MAG TPA: hypothetical protein VHD90_23345 [Phototrophicaceae bacterium]|nr:hypothetical protein [Phototrophicaceae bacterium]